MDYKNVDVLGGVTGAIGGATGGSGGGGVVGTIFGDLFTRTDAVAPVQANIEPMNNSVIIAGFAVLAIALLGVFFVAYKK